MSSRATVRFGLAAGLVAALLLGSVGSALGAPASTGYGGWHWLSPRQQGDSINAVKSIGASRVWAVGDAGIIMKTTDGGRTWRREESGVIKQLADVDFTDATHGWAVGGEYSSGGVVLRTIDGGAHWKKISTLHLVADEAIVKVDFADRTHGWVATSAGHVYKTTNAGSTWHTLTAPLSSRVTSLRFISRSTGWVCGIGGFEIGGKILKTTNGGSTWHAYSWNPELGDEGECADAMTFANSKTGWFVTSQGRIFKTTDRGKHWKASSYASSTEWEYSDVEFATSKIGWIVGNTTVLRTSNGGRTWKKPTHAVNNAVGVAHLSTTHLVALGSAGYTYRSTDRGKSWTRVGSGPRADFLSVSFGDAGHGWTVADGLILRTTNGGTTWSSQTFPADLGPETVSAPSASVGWTCGFGYIMRTTNGGTTWAQTYDAAPWTSAISAVDDMHAIAVGEDGSALWTANGGTTWHAGVTPTTQSMRGVDMVNSSVAWAVADNGTVLVTGNGGASWTQHSVSATYAVGAVDFVSATEGWVAGERAGRPAILHTADGGLIWVEQPTGTAGGLINSISFLDNMHGIAVGQSNGYGFTLSTSDGGATWHRAYSGTDPLYGCDYVTSGKQIAVGEDAILTRVPQ